MNASAGGDEEDPDATMVMPVLDPSKYPGNPELTAEASRPDTVSVSEEEGSHEPENAVVLTGDEPVVAKEMEVLNPEEFDPEYEEAVNARVRAIASNDPAALKAANERVEGFLSKNNLSEVLDEDGIPEEETLVTTTLDSESVDGTPAENKGRLRSLVERFGKLTVGAREVVASGKEKFEKSATYLANRSRELGNGLRNIGLEAIADFKATREAIAHPIETLRSVSERSLRYSRYLIDRNISLKEKGKLFIEGYNKLSPLKKTYLTAALIMGSSVAAAASLPTLSSALASGMYGTRALGGAGFALKRRQGMEARIAKNTDGWLSRRSIGFKNTYAAVLGVAYSATTAVAGHYAMGKLTGWVEHALGHALPGVIPHPHIAHEAAALSAADVAGVEAGVAPPVEAAAADLPTAAPVPPEWVQPHLPSAEVVSPHGEISPVKVVHGRGAEDMYDRLRRQLIEQHFKPEDFPPGSQGRALLEIDGKSIAAKIHTFALHDPNSHVFNADGTSAPISVDSQMTIDDQGHVRIESPTHGAPVPESPAVTPAEHPVDAAPAQAEVQPTAHEEVVPDTTQPEHTPDTTSAGVDTTQTPPATEVTSTQVPESQMPIPGHEIITNHFGVKVPLGEPHIYSDAKGTHLFAYGGQYDNPKKFQEFVESYLRANPKATVYAFGIDQHGHYRLPVKMDVRGEPNWGSEKPTYVNGLKKIFTPWLRINGPEDFRKLVQ